MVRCCRSLHSSPSCYNLHRVRVDVRRFRLSGSSAGATGEPAHGDGTGGPGPPGGPSQLSNRSRFRYRQGVCEKLGLSSGWECNVCGWWVNSVRSRPVVDSALEVREDNWRIMRGWKVGERARGDYGDLAQTLPPCGGTIGVQWELVWQDSLRDSFTIPAMRMRLA